MNSSELVESDPIATQSAIYAHVQSLGWKVSSLLTFHHVDEVVTKMNGTAGCFGGPVYVHFFFTTAGNTSGESEGRLLRVLNTMSESLQDAIAAEITPAAEEPR